MISELMKDVDKNKNDIDALKLHSKLVKDDIKNIKDYWYGLEEDTMLQILNLPNILHKKTPLENITIYATQDCIKEKSKSHMEIAEEYRYVEYFDPLTCYLKSDAALFELGILNYFRDGLSRTGFTQFSNSNFCRSVVLEGCGDNYEKPLKAFTLEEVEDSRDDINRLHLCGGASLYAFMAYFTRNLLQQTHFPLRYFSLGKKYQPANKNLPNDLFNLSQESALNIFIATLEEDDFLEETTKRVIALYEPLGHHFRLTLLAADKLERSESLRLSIQMYSNYLESYVEVGNISLYDNYLSKRLLFTYNVNKERKYPKIIGGTLLNVPRMLGCVLENSVFFNKDLMTPVLKYEVKD
ncbi:hypothetical protein NQ318_013413 [Aromia moschata]|uniref:serine--tRNA ligase n=1 Tax=Aromia moschata TaxID=1265417 RepID=A0AAV8YQ83_9CUCU|nr:hypothetical protein NQ318_013413 [Aromia moschata]